MNILDGRRGDESLGLLHDTVGNATMEEIHQNTEEASLRGAGMLGGMHEANGSTNRRSGGTAEIYDRSSSLSEIEDGTAAEGLEKYNAKSIGDADGSDTEAETERLEDSPQKLRPYKNVVLTASSDAHLVDVKVNGMKAITSRNQTPTHLVQEHNDQTLEEPSSAYSSDHISPESRFLQGTGKHRKKRKTSSEGFKEGQRLGGERRGSSLLGWTKTEDDSILPGGISSLDSLATSAGVEVPMMQGSNERSTKHLATKQKAVKGKRKGRTAGSQASIHTENLHMPENIEHAGSDIMEGIESHEEDEEMEDAEVDLATRTEEELIKKQAAMAALSAIEKCFATLRDKLFDERLARYNEELIMLNQTEPTHPEYLAQMECVDQYRDKKIDYEHTLMKYKLMTLQTTSIAEKAQAHSQYVQTIREIRDRMIEQTSKQSFQIKRERRDRIGRVPDYSFQYPTKRSQQIINQAAYNTEVSILSGVAKHVGFPAAPEVRGARPKEIDDDLRNMGVSTEARQVQPVVLDHQPSLRAIDSSAANDHFLEKNAWANPRHPSHGQRLRRHTSGLGQDTMSFVTPIAQKRLFSNGLEGSASTIIEVSSAQTSSAVATPFTGGYVNISEEILALGTPSKAQEAMAAVPTDIASLQAAGLDKHEKFAASIAKGLPDPSAPHSLDLGSRNLAQKMEDASHVPQHSPFFQGLNTVISNGIASSGLS